MHQRSAHQHTCLRTIMPASQQPLIHAHMHAVLVCPGLACKDRLRWARHKPGLATSTPDLFWPGFARQGLHKPSLAWPGQAWPDPAMLKDSCRRAKVNFAVIQTAKETAYVLYIYISIYIYIYVYTYIYIYMYLFKITWRPEKIGEWIDGGGSNSKRGFLDTHDSVSQMCYRPHNHSK